MPASPWCSPACAISGIERCDDVNVILVSHELPDRLDGGAVTGGRPAHPRALKPVPQRGAPSVVPLNPDSRAGRGEPGCARRGEMDAIYVGIDVWKERLDVHVLPSGQAFAVARDGEGLTIWWGGLQALAPDLVAMEATGGFETGGGGAGGRRAAAGGGQSGPGPALRKALGQRAKIGSDRRGGDRRFAEAVKPAVRAAAGSRQRGCWPIWSRGAGRSSRCWWPRGSARTAPRVSAIGKSVARLIEALEKELPRSTTRSTRACAARRPGATRRICSSRFPAWGVTRARPPGRAARARPLKRRQIASLAGLAPFIRESGRGRAGA